MSTFIEGSGAVKKGRLKGATDYSDHFYFFCPKCPDENIVRILDYEVERNETNNEYNDQCKSQAKRSFTLSFKLHCENCGHEDFVRLSNTGWQGGTHLQSLKTV